MSKIVKFVSYKEAGLNWGICNEIYEDGCDREIDCQLIDVELLNIMFEDRLEWEEDEGKKTIIKEMLTSLSEYSKEDLIEF